MDWSGHSQLETIHARQDCSRLEVEMRYLSLCGGIMERRTRGLQFDQDQG
jgi:hypothetical protein